MNKQVILQALQSQLDSVKAAAVEHEKNVYEPAISALTEKIAKYFAEGVVANINSITLQSDSIILYPNDSTDYNNRITLTHRSNWRGENAYIEMDTYRPDMKSNVDNSNALFYYECTAAIAKCFHTISKTYITKWQPAFEKLSAAKNQMYSEIYTIEREIRNVESEIATIEKEVYNHVGFECTIKPYTNYESDYSNNEYVYKKKIDAYHIKAQYGRSRWDYYYINSFKVISFPKAKHGKVVLEYKSAGDEKVRIAELNKIRYAEFVNDVYNWQTTRAAEREADVDERINRYNSVEA